MGRAETDEAMEFVLQSIEVGQGSPYHETAHRVAYKGDPGELIARAVFSNVLKHFLAQTISHLCNVAVRLALIGRTLQEDGLR